MRWSLSRTSAKSLTRSALRTRYMNTSFTRWMMRTGSITSRMANAARHARADGRRQLNVEDVFGHRLAGRLVYRSAGHNVGDPQGARFSDRRRRQCRCSTRARTRSPCRAIITTSLQGCIKRKRDLIVPVLQNAGFKCDSSRRRILRHGRYLGFRI